MTPEIIDWSFLKSQRAFLPSDKSREKFRALCAGFRSGKSVSLCRAGVLLSHLQPGNVGFLGRASGADLETTLYQTFFMEVCPSSLILDQKKMGQTGRMVTIRSVDPRKPSIIYMGYIIDRSTGKAHIAGMNLGWFGISQAEEIARADYLKLVGRLSLNVPNRYGLIEANLYGHNWIYEDYFAGGDYTFNPITDARNFHKIVRKDNRIGIVARSEENRVSNGGFVDDDYFDELRRTYPPEWIARHVDGSFDDFVGKIFTGYHLTSIHNIERFEIPKHWGWVVSIDPGGSDPNCVGVFRIDTEGNLIGVDEFYLANVVPDVIMDWINKKVPVKDTRFVIDYENRLFTLQLQQQFGILCEPAMKDVYAGCQQAASFFYVNPYRKLPDWFVKTQPAEVVERYKGKGSPRIFMMRDKMPNVRRSCDNYVWDEKKPTRPKPSPDDHGGDMVRYLCNSNIVPSQRSDEEAVAWNVANDPLRHLLGDPTSYSVAKSAERIMARVLRSRNPQADWSTDGMTSPTVPAQDIITDFL